MKKILLASLIGFLPAMLIAQPVAMNSKDNTRLPVATEAGITTANAMGGLANSSAKSARELRKAERETRQFARITNAFSHHFENVSGVRWSSGKSEFVASFIKDGNRNTAWYNKGGNLLYSMQTYTADKLPHREQAIIRNEYNGYKMTSVDEVRQHDIIVYVVHLENDRNIKLITVCDGATNVYREYRKM